MKYIYLLFTVILGGFLHAQIINFPDANFKAKLLQANATNGIALNMNEYPVSIDTNNNGEIEVSEVQNIKSLNVNNSGISTLDGISNFTNLKWLQCANNLLTEIAIDDAIIIQTLIAHHNTISSISVNFLDSLEEVDLSYNNLTSFVAENFTSHEGFNLNNNQLTTLVLHNVSMVNFNVSYNNLSQIQFIGDVWFFNSANFSHNQFTLLNLTQAKFSYDSLIQLGYNNEDQVLFGYNRPGNIMYRSDATTFDLGNFHGTTSCDPESTGNVSIANSPNLQNIIFKNGYNHGYITCNEGGTIFQMPAMDLEIFNCPSLTHICVDEGTEQTAIQARINQLGLQNQVQVNSYCTFTPGGEFYTINGTTRYDLNANGCDGSDLAVSNQKFTITNATQTSTIIANDLGDFTINVGSGTHTITPIVENPAGFTISPTNIAVSFPAQSSPFLQDFCLTATAPLHDFDITLIPLNAARPGFDAHYRLVFKNTGNVIATGTIILDYDDAVLDWISSSVVPSSTNNALNWDFVNLQPFETRSIDVTFNLNAPTETPPLNGNDVIEFTSSIGENGASQPFSNLHLLHQTVVNSFDPNDKVCLEGTLLNESYVGGFVTYQIRFENTGNFAAQNVVVKDVIDTTKFNINSLMPIASSHDFYTRIVDNKVEFVFENINLPFDDASNDGFVVFKIQLVPSVTAGVTFSNSASIYFDYNFPIETPLAVSSIELLSTDAFVFDEQFVISPVPAKNSLQINSKSSLLIERVEIYNQLGQIVQSEVGINSTVDVSRLSKGSYFLKVRTKEGVFVKQFLKE